MMKYAMLIAAVSLLLALVAGCAKRAVEYVPKDATESAILAFAKQKVPNLVVTNISAPPRPDGAGVPEALKKAQSKIPSPYMVIFADPKDASMQTTAAVFYNADKQAIEEKSFVQPPPVTKSQP